MKNSLSKAVSAVVGAGLLLGSVQALAYEKGDIVVRAGYANVAPNDSSDGLALPVIGQGPISGTEAEVDAGAALGITATYMLSNSLGIELLAATPFEHDVKADLGGLGKVDAGSTKHLPPTVSLVWYPLTENNSAFQPYVGVGVNYTTFFQEDVDSDLQAGAPGVVNFLTGAETLAPNTPVSLDLELEDSWGLAAQIGFDYALNEKWHINASVRWIDIDTEATFGSALSSKTITVDNVEIDPYVYQINVGYTF